MATVSIIISRTESLCPVCMEKIDAVIVLKGERYVMQKVCPVHGAFEATVWKGSTRMERWTAGRKRRDSVGRTDTEILRGCPFDCGICSEHRQETCTALIEVTQRCNLNCSFCFADSKYNSQDPSIEKIKDLYRRVLKNAGTCNIQLSGGEPTLRNDLPEIVRYGKELGFPFVQVNTNGIRLAEDEKFVAALKAAGLNSLFLQFDGTNDAIYRRLRGKDLLKLKVKTIENCKKYGIGVILVPTLVPDVNIDNIGEIINFALSNIQAVKGVHFQPVSYFGRIPKPPKERDRVTLAEVMDEIEKQTGGRVTAASLKPPKCEHSLCSFHGRYLYQGEDGLMPISGNSGCCSRPADDGAAKAKAYVSRNWASRESSPADETADSSGWDKILSGINKKSFSISAMAFQDVWNIDLNRVRECCIHVVSPEGKLIPFCLYNVTDTEGRALYRK